MRLELQLLELELVQARLELRVRLVLARRVQRVLQVQLVLTWVVHSRQHRMQEMLMM